MDHTNLGGCRMEMLRANLTAEQIYDVLQLKQGISRLFPHVHLSERRLASRYRPKNRFQVREVALEASGDEEDYEHERVNPCGHLGKGERRRSVCLRPRHFVLKIHVQTGQTTTFTVGTD